MRSVKSRASVVCFSFCKLYILQQHVPIFCIRTATCCESVDEVARTRCGMAEAGSHYTAVLFCAVLLSVMLLTGVQVLDARL